jgi:hypothetical protein
VKVHWLIKYYFIGFIVIFSIAYKIEKSEPYVDWSLYEGISDTKIKNMILNKNCKELLTLYNNEYDENYDKNFLGFIIRKEKKMIRGLNLLKYLSYHLEQNDCSKV